MNKKRVGLITLVTLLVGAMVGCGTPLYELTPSEEQIIVAYSAEVLSKYNIYQMDGIQYVEPQSESSETTETDSGEKDDGQKPDDASDQPNELAGAKTLEDALNLGDISFSFKKLEVMDYFDDNGVSAATAEKGKTFVVLTFKMTADASQKLDLVKSKHAKYTLTVGDKSYTHKSTVLPSDLASYYGDVEAGAKDVILLFEVSQSEAETIEEAEDFTLSVEINGTKSTIKL